MDSEWIDTKEASKISGYSQEYIRQLVRAGDVTGQKIGWAMLVSRSSILAYRKTQEAKK